MFWELEIAVEVQKREIVYFLNRIINHNAVNVQGEIRNVVDAFVHKNVLIWKDKQQERVTREHKGEPKKKRRIFELEKFRARNSGDFSLGGIENVPEST